MVYHESEEVADEAGSQLAGKKGAQGDLNSYCLITINHAATIGPCGPPPRPPVAGGVTPARGAGAGPRSGWKRYALCVTGSTAIVFAPANVSTVATVMYLSGESWWTTVTLPSPPFGM